MEFELKEIDQLSGPKAHIYSVIPDGEDATLLEQFFEENAAHKDDLNKIIHKLLTMANDTGCRKTFFKEGEGNWADGVVALKGTGLLRLYGIYFNDSVVLFGSGGYKSPETRAYQEDPLLNSKAQKMKDIAKEINRLILNRELIIGTDGNLIEQ
ncbi:MAG TPA: hypothetical protein PLN34_02220 [Alloprevotella sp.]|nr:hypothetical protein [Alloprevotella sp.]